MLASVNISRPSLLGGKIDIDAHNILHLVPSRYVQRAREQAKENRKYNHKAIKGGAQSRLDRLKGFHMYYLASKHQNQLTMKCTYPINSGLAANKATREPGTVSYPCH